MRVLTTSTQKHRETDPIWDPLLWIFMGACLIFIIFDVIGRDIGKIKALWKPRADPRRDASE